jgi:hypothetical protein
MIEQTVSRDFSEKRNDVDSRTYRKQAVICALLGIYWIVFFWNIWDSDRGVHALGFNATFFVLVVLYLLGLGTPEKSLCSSGSVTASMRIHFLRRSVSLWFLS